MSNPIREIFRRLGEILLAALAVGGIVYLWAGFTAGTWGDLYIVFVVPLSLVWGVMLATFVARDLTMGLFLLLTALTGVLVWLVARRVPNAWLRLGALTVIFALQQLVMAQLMALTGITG